MAKATKPDAPDKKTDNPEEGDEVTLEGTEAAKGLPIKGKRLIILIIGIVLLLAGAGGTYFYIVHKKEVEAKAKAAKTPATAVVPDLPPAVYVPMADFLVNLSTTSTQPSFLKMTIVLEVANASDQAAIEQNMPLIRDSFLTYLRELRSEDLQGSAGIFRLREELLLRVNKLLYPVEVKDVLFKQIIVQ